MSNVETFSLIDKLKEVFKHSLVYGLTSSFQSLLGFLLLPILTVYYTPDIFGVYSILLLMSALASAVFYLGASSALGRFYHEQDTDIYRKKIVTTAIIITIGGGLLLIGLSLASSSFLSTWLFQTDKYSLAIILIMVGTAITFLLNLMTMVVRYEKKSVTFFLVTILSVILNFVITYILLTEFYYGILAPIYGLLISNLVSFLVLLFLHVRLISFRLERQHFILILSFGIQSSAAGLLFYALDWADRLIIKDLLSLSQVGIYSLGYKLGAVLNILVVMPFSLIWAPIRMQYAKNENSSPFTTKVLSYYTIVGVSVVFLSILFGSDLMHLFFKNKAYGEAAAIFPIIMLSFLFYGYQGIVDFGIYLHKKVYFYALVSVCAIFFNIGLNYWLIPIYGYMAAAFVNVFTYLFTSSAIYLISSRYYMIRIEWSRVVFPILILIPVYLTLNFSDLNSYLVKIFVLCLIVFLFLKLWIDKDEVLHLKRVFKSLKRETS